MTILHTLGENDFQKGLGSISALCMLVKDCESLMIYLFKVIFFKMRCKLEICKTFEVETFQSKGVYFCFYL